MRPIEDLIPYAQNARTHSAEQIEKLRRSLREFGFLSPLLIDAVGNVIAGHGRLMAAAAEGMAEVPCVVADGLTDAQRRAYILADNRLCELGGWDADLLKAELDDLDISGFDVTLSGFAGSSEKADRPDGDTPDDYETFLQKFAQKHTTDDCFTPENIYQAVADYCTERYGIDPSEIVRPFYPGGDYQNFRYDAGAVVVDNPPFSILSEIVSFYNSHGIKYFLFAPAVSLLSYDCTAIAAYVGITYANGAVVNTSFLTNMEPGVKVRTDAALSAVLDRLDKENSAAAHNHVGVYEYPLHLVTAAMMGLISHRGVDLQVSVSDCQFVRALDSQKELGKAIFGGGLLLSEKAAAEKAAAEKWELSEREWAIVRGLGDGKNT